MQYLLLVYTDAELLDKLPEAEFNVKMRDCIRHSDDQKTQGKLLMCQQLEPVSTARTVRVRNGRAAVLDGPARKSVRVDPRNRRLGDEVPIRQQHHLNVVNALPAQLAQRKVDTFDGEHRVLKVTVDETHSARAVPREFLEDVLDGRRQRMAVETRGAAQMIAAATLLL